MWLKGSDDRESSRRKNEGSMKDGSSRGREQEKESSWKKTRQRLYISHPETRKRLVLRSACKHWLESRVLVLEPLLWRKRVNRERIHRSANARNEEGESQEKKM